MASIKLSFEDIQNSFSDTIFERGKNYQTKGLVNNLKLRDAVLSADVEGSEYQPYKIRIQFNNYRIDTAVCSCPYDESFMGYCKHIAATLLQYHYEPQNVQEEESLATILEPLDVKELRGALEHLLSLYPEAIDRLELYLKKPKQLTKQLTKQKTQKKSKPTLAKVNLDTTVYEKMLNNAVHATKLDWDGMPDYDTMDSVFEEIHPFLENESYAEALVLTENLMQEFIDSVSNNEEINYSDNIGFSDGSVFIEFDKCLVEAIYGTELHDSDRKRLVHQILQWHDDTNNDWNDPKLVMSAHALISGFDSIDAEAEELIQEITKDDFDESDQYVSEQIKLRVIQQSGDLDSALDFAKTQGHDTDYLIILSNQGKLEQLMDEYKEYLHRDVDTLRVVEHLVDNYPSEAFEISSYRLAQVPTEQPPFEVAIDPSGIANTLAYAPKRRELATFCKDLAKTFEAKNVQMDAAIIEFQYEPKLTRYLELQVLAADNWNSLKQELLKALFQERYGYSKLEAAVDIFLHEKLFDNAIAMTTRSFSNDRLLHKIMPVVVHTHADWVITQAEHKAEEIMDAGKAKYYDRAVGWLEHSNAAYLAHNRKTEWEAYLFGIRAKHGKKRKLMGLIEHL